MRATRRWGTALLLLAAACGGNEASEAPARLRAQEQRYTSGQNLIPDPGFESGTSGFTGSSTAVTFTRSTASPITGTASLDIGLPNWGDRASILVDPAWNSGTFAQTLTMSATLRVLSGSAGAPLSFCAYAYYQDSSTAVFKCQDVDAGTRDNRVASVSLDLDKTRELDRVYFWVRLNGQGPATVKLDDANLTLWATTPSGPPPTSDGQELLSGGGFESTTAGFEVTGTSSTVSRSTTSPLSGTASLRAHLAGWGNTLFALRDFDWNSGTTGTALRLRAKLRVDAGPAGAPLVICPMAYYQDSSTAVRTCQNVDAGTRTLQSLDLTTPLDGTRQLDRVYFWVKLEGNGPVDLTLDDASLVLVGGNAPGGNPPPPPPPPPDPNPIPNPTPGPAPTGTKLIEVALRPHASVAGAGTTRVSFGLPLPPGLLTDATKVIVQTSAGVEIPAFTRALAVWRALPPAEVRCAGVNTTAGPGIRSLLVQLDRAFASTAEERIRIIVNATPASRLSSEVPVRDTFRLVNEGTFSASHGVYEPKVYAAIPKEILACAGIGTASAPAGRDTVLAKTDTAQGDFFYTAINEYFGWQVDPANRIPYQTDYEPWLYDRAQVFFNGYVRTGNFDMLREGVRASHFLFNQLYQPGDCGSLAPERCAGFFKLKNPDAADFYKDEKYSYNESLWTWYLLTGDSLPYGIIDDVAVATRYGDSSFDVATLTGQFTERNAGNGLLADVIRYEATGETAVRDRVLQAIGSLRAMQQTPAGGLPANGCFNHKGPDWETEYGFSPWMSALVGHALVRAYQVTGDSRIPPMLSDLANCVLSRGTYFTTRLDGVSRRVPLYGGASTGPLRELDAPAGSTEAQWDPWAQMEHASDVAYLLATGALFSTDTSRRDTLLAATRELVTTHEYVIAYWTRSSSGLAKYRLTPPRKYNWWYHNAGGIGWTLGGAPAF